jgi:EAL domain-containing protein (putative c-di-GMP-specific phosphodiesterase class I)
MAARRPTGRGLWVGQTLFGTDRDTSLLEHLIDLLTGFSISRWRLSVEIAESEVLDNSLVLVALESLRAWGIEIALDNSDTRHSSLDHLERFPSRWSGRALQCAQV